MLFDEFLVFSAVDPHREPEVFAHSFDIVRMYAEIPVVLFGEDIIIGIGVFAGFLKAADIDIVGNALSAVADLERGLGKKFAERVVVPRDGTARIAQQHGYVHIGYKIERMRCERLAGKVVLDLAAAEV